MLYFRAFCPYVLLVWARSNFHVLKKWALPIRLRMLLVFFYCYFFWIWHFSNKKKECINSFRSLFIPFYGLTCHVDDYNSEILSFDWSMAWTNARRENTVFGRLLYGNATIWMCVNFVSFSSLFFVSFLSFFFIQRISQLTAIHLNQCNLKETDAKEKRCVLLMLISCSRLYL